MSVGYIKLHRSLLDWQHWDDHNTTRLLIYFLVSVNYELKKWKGIEVLPGSMVTSYDQLSIATGLSVKQIRRSLKVLVDDKQVIQKTASKFQLVTLVKWEELQLLESEEGRQRAGKGQAKGRQRATTKESIIITSNNNTEEGKEIKKSTNVDSKKTPSLSDRKEIFKETLRQYADDFDKEMINKFFLYWSEEDTHGKKMKFEMEKTWNLKGRLTRWKLNNFDSQSKPMQPKQDAVSPAHQPYIPIG